MSSSKKTSILALIAAIALMFTGSAFAAGLEAHTTTQVSGSKANTGFVTHSNRDGKNVLTLSDDFIVPDTPDPHWQVVTSDGAVFLLDKIKIKNPAGGDKVRKEITLPAYVKDVATVQIYCAWAEVVLGEASFDSPVK